jgi:hypothetical protein
MIRPSFRILLTAVALCGRHSLPAEIPASSPSPFAASPSEVSAAPEEGADPLPLPTSSPTPSKNSRLKKAPDFIDGKTTSERIDAARRYWDTLRVSSYNRLKGDTGTIAANILRCLEQNKPSEIPKLLDDWKWTVNHVYRTDRRVNLNPFFKINLVYAYAVCRNHLTLPEEISKTTRDYVALSGHRIFTGYNAMNYELMKDGTGFIAAEIWPELVDADGLNANQIKQATKERLYRYFDEIARGKNPEYGASIYLGADMIAVKMLVDCAQDPEVRQRATITLDAMLLQIACAWQDGYYVTPISRAKGWPNCITSPENMETTAGIAWLYFGGRRPINPGMIPYWFVLPKDATPNPAYRPPAILSDIANDRSQPFTHLGTIGNICRYSIYHGESGTYALATQREGYHRIPTINGHFKELCRNNLKWVSDSPVSSFSPRQDNDATPYTAGFQGHNPNHASGGENVYSRTMQHEGTLLGICSVPEKYPFSKSYAAFTKQGAIHLRTEQDGWVFCHGGSTLFAFRYVQPSSWMTAGQWRGVNLPNPHYDIIQSEDRNNGWILETVEAKNIPGGNEAEQLKNFSAMILGKTSLDASQINGETPSFTFTSLSGNKLTIGWFDKQGNSLAEVDGKPIDYASFPILGNPWVKQPLDGDTLTITHGGRSLTYDFKNWTITGDQSRKD